MSAGAVPDFVPPPLRGRIGDFRNEPDGSVSFAHPEVTLGASPDDARVRLSQEQYKQTFDTDYRRRHPIESLRGMYNGQEPTNLRDTITGGIGRSLRRFYDWGTSDGGKAVGTAGLLSALAGGIGGFMLGRRNGESGVRKALIAALLAGGLGAAASAYSQRRNNARQRWLDKQASASPVTAALIHALESDPSLSQLERARLLRAMANLGQRERDDLYRSMRTAFGAGAGVLVARFLGSRGLLPMVAGGVIGAIVGNAASPPRTRYNALGQLSMSNYI